nr:hypothetical protein [Tanacetum cinerariifolium]
ATRPEIPCTLLSELAFIIVEMVHLSLEMHIIGNVVEVVTPEDKEADVVNNAEVVVKKSVNKMKNPNL